MNITYNSPAPRCLGELTYGDVFTFQTSPYPGDPAPGNPTYLGPYFVIRKTSAIECDIQHHCCVHLETGEFRRFNKSREIILHEATLIIDN